MEEKKVSVIIPCYNGEKFVDRCLMSIDIQEYPYVECIVVDDGSKDQSKNKIKKYENIFENKGWELIYYYQENQGLGAAINAGLKLVTGEYLMLLDIDDEYLPGAIQEKAEYLNKHQEVDVVRSNGWMKRGDNKHLFINDMTEKKEENIFDALIRGETNNWAGSYMLRVKKLFEFYPDKEIYCSRYGQNLQLLLPLLYKKKCGYIDKPHMNYIRQDNSLSVTVDNSEIKNKVLENIAGYTDIRNEMINLIIKDDEEKKRYLEQIEKTYWKSILQFGCSGNYEEIAERAYRELKKRKGLELQDRIIYEEKRGHRIRNMLFRCLRKVRTIVCTKKSVGLDKGGVRK